MMKSPLDNIEWIYLFLDELNYSGWEIEIIISEASLSATTSEDAPVEGARKIETSPDSRRFKIKFDSVLSFQVTDESWAAPDKKAEGTFGPICVLDKSEFLDYIKKTTYDQIYENYTHYSVMTSDDIIDVISTEPPIVEELNS